MTMATESLLDRLEELARRAAEPLGIEVAWIQIQSEGPACFFRVFIDRESGVGLDDCERVSERLGVLLDVEDPIETSYTLEVSTPGLDRPLWKLRDYQRFAGRLATVRTTEPIDERSRFHGRLGGVEGDVVLLEDETGPRRIPFAAISSGRLEVELFRGGLRGRPGKRHLGKARKRA